MNEKLDEVAELMQEILQYTENTLRTVPVLGLVRQTPIAKIHSELRKKTEEQIAITTQVLGTIGNELGVSTSGLVDDAAKNIERVSKQFRLSSVDELKKNLFKATQQGIEHQPKVVTKSGRKWGYKEYMEMNIRTTLAHEIGEMQLDAGGSAGVVFYLCNTFMDSADDHALYQGRYYYDERYKTFGYDKETEKVITDTIRSKKILPMQYVRENAPYLGTRPNCRHTFMPISIEQATGKSPKRMTQELKLSTGTYKDKNYRATQSLREIELNLRNYDYKMRINRQLARDTNDLELKDKFTKVMLNNKKLVDRWNKRKNNLIEKHSFLKDDSRRELRSIVLNDLGVRYNIKSFDNSNII